jgi:hypothetical protein
MKNDYNCRNSVVCAMAKVRYSLSLLVSAFGDGGPFVVILEGKKNNCLFR